LKLAPGTPLLIGILPDEGAAHRPVGRLAMADGVAQLEWSREAIAAGLPISPLQYPREPGLHAARSREFDGLHGFLADSLPDAWGTLLLRRQLQKRGQQLERLSVVERLALIGRRGRGALIFQPESLDEAHGESIDLDRLAQESQQLLKGEDAALGELLAQLGGGSGGARPKVHVSFAADGSLVASDLLSSDGAAGQAAGEWIVKFRALGDPTDIGPVEEAYARMARAAGITMSETRLIPARGGGGHFAARRFDRPASGKRLHMISLGGAVEASPHMPSLDYDCFLRATLSITRDMRDLEQVFRRMVFNIFAHNRDDHARQHAYLMDDKGVWRLSPAFDLTFSHGPGGEHYMAVAGEGSLITRAHIAALGARHGIAVKRIAAIVDAVRAAVADWAQYARETDVSVSRAEIGAALMAMDAVICK
jgi:serine/threonine-protein kinase HipA